MKIVGLLLFYEQAIDHTMLVTPIEITSAQSNETKTPQKEDRKLIDYCTTYPKTKVCYQKIK